MTSIYCTVPQGVSQVVMHLYDSTGRAVGKQAYTVNSGINQLKWSADVPGGIYFCILTGNGLNGDNKRSNMHKIVVNKD